MKGKPLPHGRSSLNAGNLINPSPMWLIMHYRTTMTSMTRQKTKDEERMFLERFNIVSKRFDFSKDSVNQSQTSPDFVIQTDGMLVGVEITKVMQLDSSGDPMSLVYSNIIQRIRQKVIDELNDRSHAPCFLTIELLGPDFRGKTIHFRSENRAFDPFDLPGHKMDLLAKAIVDKVETLQPPLNDHSFWENNGSNASLAIVKSIRLRPQNKSTEVWVGPLSYWSKLDCHPEIQWALSDKDTLVDDYRKKCGRVCLLLVVDTHNASIQFEIENPATEHIFESLADEAYVLQINACDQVFPLRIKPPHR